MSGAWRDVGHESEVLLRQLDGHLASVRAERDPNDVALAERVAAALRRLVVETAFASAADRARVRAAVHYFVLRRDARVVNEIVRGLGRADLLLGAPAPVPEPA